MFKVASEVVAKLINVSKSGELGKVVKKWAADKGIKGKLSEENRKELSKYLADYIVNNRLVRRFIH